MKKLLWICIVITLTACGGSAFDGLGGSNDGGTEGEASVPDSCTPKTCEDLGYVCGVANDDGCGGEVVCGPAYIRHPNEDYPALDAEKNGCTSTHPYAWACGPYAAPGGDAPMPDCVKWGGSATWCCN